MVHKRYRYNFDVDIQFNFNNALVSKLNRMERYSSYGLSALAVFDLLICLIMIPYSFLVGAQFVMEEDLCFTLYYWVYGVVRIKLFMMVTILIK